MSPAVPFRLSWAIEQLPPRVHGPVLEIGCGAGQAAALIATRYPGVSVTAIDRSATQLARACGQLATLLERGRVQLACVALEHASAVLDPAAYALALAINVNAFWRTPDRAFAAVRALLAPGGRLVLVFELPGAARLPLLADELTGSMRAHEFSHVSGTIVEGRTPLLCVQGVRAA